MLARQFPVRDVFRRVVHRHTRTIGILRTFGLSPLLPATVWQRLPVDREFSIKLPGPISVRYRSYKEDSIGRVLFWRGALGFETETARVFLRLAQTAKLFLDIGANTGWFSLLLCAANKDLRAYAFEPVPRIYEVLRTNVEINQFEGRCHPVQMAVSDADGQAGFHVPAGEFPSSASLHSGGFRECQGTLVQVPVVCIDNFLPEGESPDLVKLDTEGFEDKALAGMLRHLELSRPNIIVECLPDGPYQAVERVLRPFGYRFYHLLGNGPSERNGIVPDPREEYRNYLCSTKGLECL